MDNRPVNELVAVPHSLSTMLFSAQPFLAEIDRPELLTHGFIKLLCRFVHEAYLSGFIALIRLTAANKKRSHRNDLKPVEEYIQQYAKPNPGYFG